MKEEKKLAWFLSHPIQYFAPLLRELAEKTSLEVYYYSDAGLKGGKDKGFGQEVRWDIPLTEGYSSRFLRNISRRTSMDNHFLDAVNPGILRAIRKEKADVLIVNGWTYSSTLLVIFFGRLFGKKIWLRAESPLNQELKKSSKVLLLKKIFLKQLLFRFFVSRFLYIGKESRAFFEYYGVASSRLVYTPYAVDNAWFSGQYRQLKDRLPVIRQELGLPVGKKIILFSGKYIDKKRPMDLLEAFHRLNDPNAALVMVGEGELRGEMERFIRERGLRDVYLTGFINQSRIPEYYAVADVFVMCSGAGETWGLSVNEAMNFNLPVIVSATCGSAADLVHPGKNGFVFETGDTAALTSYLQKTLSDEAFRAAAGAESAAIIRDYSIGHIVTNLAEALP